MRTINVTGGYTDYAVGTITERTGKDLSSATFKAALIGRTAPVPTSGSSVWRTAEVSTPSAGKAVVSLLVGSETAPGDYYLWVDIADNPTVVPVKAGNEIVRVV